MTYPASPIDILRPPLLHPARALVDDLSRAAPRLLWRSLHPWAREGFDDGGTPPPVERLEARTSDGWRLPVSWVGPMAGGAGEPVVLLHSLGLGPDSFRYGRGATLVGRLKQQGFGCYLPCWRGDVEATAPRRGAAPPSFEQVVEHDLPAILDVARRHAGARRVLVVGHGLGGLAALGWAATSGTDELAGLVAMSVPVRFPRLPRLARLGLGLAGLVGRSVPTRRLARLAAVWTGAERGSDGAGPLSSLRRPPAGPRLRGGLVHAAEDVSVGLLDQLRTWCEAGALVDGGGRREYGASLSRVVAPLMVLSSSGDTWCPPERVESLEGLWGGAVTVCRAEGELGHLDLLLHPRADGAVFRPVAAWLDAQRARCWSDTVDASMGTG